MPALIDLRRRIKSVKNTQQITKAMKTVSTAKFKKAQRTLLEGRPYWHNSPALVGCLASWAEECKSPLFDEREERRIHVVVITSDKGLCGAFNSNLMAKTQTFLREKAKTSEVRLMLVGKKAVNYFRRQPYAVELAYTDKIEKISLGELKKIGRDMMRLYAFQKTDGVYIAYNEFKSILAPRIMLVRLLPIPVPEEETAGSVVPDWEPGEAKLLEYLLPLYVESQIYHAFFESLAAEQAARMMAMENATRNAEELISDLILILNKIRQASITKELLEIMTAVEAMAK
jgi:F-type H+-transporting ATPase subunit gamma